eukprot:12091868-Ditylum_brightwellii.AAC.1
MLSAAEWTFNADIILKLYSDQANGCIIKDPTNDIIQEQNVDMIVDDVTMQHNAGQYHLDAQALMNICQQDIKLWDELLWVNGGLLGTLKTSYSLMIWNFDGNGRPTIQTEESLPPNTVHLTRKGETACVRRVAETEGVKILGVHKALNLQEHSALQHFITKTHTFANAINACPIP